MKDGQKRKDIHKIFGLKKFVNFLRKMMTKKLSIVILFILRKMLKNVFKKCDKERVYEYTIREIKM